VEHADSAVNHEAPPSEPRVIPRSQHSLSRKQIDGDALKVLYRLHNHGYLAYLVGGSVRDLLLGRRPKDFDVSTDARPSQIYKLFRNSRVIGKRFRLVQVFFRGGKIIEVSTFRQASENGGNAEAEAGDEVLQANNTFGDPGQDAMRRDLTINAMFYNIADYSIVDYVDGLADLKAGLIRSVGTADVRFHRDPVRVLRAVRHAARTGFSLTEDTLAAVVKRREELCLCPTSRVRDELMRDVKGGAAAAWLELAHTTGVLYTLMPGLSAFYQDEKSPLRAAAATLLGRVDAMMAAGREVDDAVALSALIWPALEEQSLGREFSPGRPGRAQWQAFVRESLPGLTQPVAFAKRVMERCSQIGGVMGFLREEKPGARLPKKVTDKGYFPDACLLAEVLGRDLKTMAGSAKPAGGKKRRRRRRKRKPRPKTAQQ